MDPDAPAEPPEPGAGLWPSPWPAEDGGPARPQASPRWKGLGLTPGAALEVTTRFAPGTCMAVLREPGEVYLQGSSVPTDPTSPHGTTAWVERVHPESLEALVRSPDLPGGLFWPGGISAHRDGSLYVTHGRYCHRLDPGDLRPLASRELPRDRAYNSHVVLPDGHLVTKDIAGGSGRHTLPESMTGSELVVLAPGTLEVVARTQLPEGSVARLSADVDAAGTSCVYAVGERRAWRLRWDPVAATLTLDESWCVPYVHTEGQSFGWDPVLAGGSCWFLDDGEGTEDFGPSLRGKGANTAPLSLVRIPTSGAAAEATLTPVSGCPGGLVANPPAVDPERRIVIGFDTGNGVLAAWSYGEPGEPLRQRWRRDQDHGAHLLLAPGTGEVVSGDFDHERVAEQVVVLDVDSGKELARADTGSPLQSVIFPAPGWERDAYVLTFATITRVHAHGSTAC